MSVTEKRALLLLFFQAKSSVFEAVGYDGGHRKSLIPVVSFEVLPLNLFLKYTSAMKHYRVKSASLWLYYIRFFLGWQVKQESLGIPTKMVLKVDVESGKLYFIKSKDGQEDKYFVHNKSKTF